MHNRLKGSSSLIDALPLMGQVHLQQSTVEAPWSTYKTGARHWVRFRLGVQRRHPNQVLKGQFDRRSRLPILEDDAEQQLINFVEWLGLAGTVAPDSIEGYVSAVKAIHMVWCGHPYAAMSPLFFRLPKVIQGLRKSRAIQKTPPMKGISRRHLETWFQQSGTNRDTSEPSAPATETKANRNLRGKRYSAEGLMTLMWQAILRPDEALGTENKPNEPQCSYLVFFNRNSLAVSYATPYALISYVEYHPHGRKNDQVGENPPIVLGADRGANAKFCACWHMHRLLNFMKPDVTRLDAIPLFPKIPGSSSGNTWQYRDLVKLIKRMMSSVLGVPLKHDEIKRYAGKSPRIGGAIALHDAGTDGLTIAAMGQWKSDVYKIYLRTARFKALPWSIRMSSGMQATWNWCLFCCINSGDCVVWNPTVHRLPKQH